MDSLQQLAASFANAVWGTPLVVLLLGGGLFFALYSRFLPLPALRSCHRHYARSTRYPR